MRMRLDSLQTLCINRDVLDLGNSTQINERCLDLQDSGCKKQKTAKVCLDSGPIFKIHIQHLVCSQKEIASSMSISSIEEDALVIAILLKSLAAK